MKRTLRLFLSAAVAAAVVAASVHYVSSRRIKQVIATLDEPVGAVLQKLTSGAASGPAFATPAADAQPDVALQAKGDSRTVLLSEPVIILSGTRSLQAALPKGTQVALLATDGRYARIRHLDRVLTVPRSAMSSGIYRTN